MNQCLQRALFLIAVCLLALPFGAQALPDSLIQFSSLSRALQQYRQKDDLDGWIYYRLAFVDKKPVERIDFLMHTQKEAWRSYQTYEERLAWFDLLALQGYYQLQTGNILSSITAYETALRFYESYPLPDADIIEYVLKPLGNNYTRLSDYTTALYIHEKTLALALKRKDPDAVASVYSNMAICARWKGDLYSATDYCRKGITYVNREKALYGLLLGVYADVLTEQHRYDTAALLCRQSLGKLKGEDASVIYWRTGILQTAARIALEQKQYTIAAVYANKARVLLNQYFPLARWREKAKVQVLLGDIHLKKGCAEPSLRYYQQALTLLLPSWKGATVFATPPEELLYSENTIGDALAGKAAALKAMHQPEKALQHYLAVFIAGQKLRRAFYSTESKLKELEVSRARADAAMSTAYKLWNTTHRKEYQQQMLLIAELSKAQVLADERFSRMFAPGTSSPSNSLLAKAKQLQQAITYYQHELIHATDKKTTATLLQTAEYELSLLNKEINQQVFPQSGNKSILTVEQLHGFMKHLPANVSTLEFFEGADSSYILELNATGIQSVHVIPESRKLKQKQSLFMQRWFAKGPSAMIQAPDSFYLQCHQIYTSIFGRYKWKEGQRYILIPDGTFNYLPFDALLTGPEYVQDIAQWPWLLKKVTLSLAYSLQLWYQQQTATYPRGDFSAFFVSQGKDQAQPALAVAQEYHFLKGKISGAYYLDSMATWSAFTSAASHTAILHISTHAVSSARDTFPYLQLYDRPFYLFDLRYQRFTPSLIVLGACKTADGLLLEGEGVNSISRAFVAAGAGGVVSGLWNVNDEAAIELTQLFYKKLQEEQDPALALHRAKLLWLEKHKDQQMLQLPYYWAGFIYNGHLQHVPLYKKEPNWWNYWGGLLLLPLAAGYIIIRKRKKSSGR